ncbi:MAG: tetratricopeptide repeat protein [Bryobacteraceae bacterium]|nr:tetratricopeptide repeat protein [Bryobacteraceae bacterium]
MAFTRQIVLAVVAAGFGLAQTTTSPAAAQQPIENANLRETTDRSVITPVEGPTELTAHKRGDILMARKMYREAIETYQEGVKEAAVMYNKLGIAYHHLNDFDKALEYYNQSLRLNPSYSEAMNNIGTVYYAKKNAKRAIAEYQKALKFAPNSASIYSNLGTALFARKKYDAAFGAWQKAFELDPEVFERRSGYGTLLQERSVEERAKFHFYLAKTYAKAGQNDRALLYIRKALEEGFSDKDKIRKDPDFQALAGSQEFETLLTMEHKVL